MLPICMLTTPRPPTLQSWLDCPWPHNLVPCLHVQVEHANKVAMVQLQVVQSIQEPIVRQQSFYCTVQYSWVWCGNSRECLFKTVFLIQDRRVEEHLERCLVWSCFDRFTKTICLFKYGMDWLEHLKHLVGVCEGMIWQVMVKNSTFETLASLNWKGVARGSHDEKVRFTRWSTTGTSWMKCASTTTQLIWKIQVHMIKVVVGQCETPEGLLWLRPRNHLVWNLQLLLYGICNRGWLLWHYVYPYGDTDC